MFCKNLKAHEYDMNTMYEKKIRKVKTIDIIGSMATTRTVGTKRMLKARRRETIYTSQLFK